MELNRLLKRQIRRKLGGMDNIPAEWMLFIEEINKSYEHFEKDREMIERAMELSSEELRKSIIEKERADHQAKVKSEFLSLMSHEIRTPLNAVVGMTNILLEENPKENQLQNLNILKFSADLLLSLINDILDFNKIEAGKVVFEEQPFDLYALIHNLSNSFSIKAATKNIKLHALVDDHAPQFVLGDSLRISQILINLLGNAIKFTNEGLVEIRVKCLEQKDGNTLLRFSVQDTGIGIPKEKFNQIFQRFSQAETSTTRQFGGTGLGLSITQRLLELMDTKIELESQVGKGSCFSFKLNLKIAAATINPSIPPGQEAGTTHLFEGRKVLLVEDNNINVIVAKRFLEKWSLDVDVAENGKIAIDKVQSKDYELILMDLHMPIMDGYDAAKAIRLLPHPKFKELPIVALTASADSLSRQQVFKSGMNEVVLKPFQPEELHKTLEHFLNSSRNQSLGER